MESRKSQGTTTMLLHSFIKGRWMMAVVSLYILFCTGATYIFGIYSGAIKEALGYNQETLNTLGFFKDIGANIGILSALMYEVLPPWTLLVVGASMNLFGYLMVWLAVTHRIARPPTWHMYLFICAGANSQTFSSTAVLVTFVRNFPQGRGEVMGVLKGCIGLSGAIFTQAYLAIYGDDTRGVILLIGWLPSLVSLMFIFLIRPMTLVYDKRETLTFYYFLYLAMFLAAFLMFAIILENVFHHIPSVAYKVFGALTLILVISNVIIGIHAEYKFQAQVEERASTKSNMLEEVIEKDEAEKAELEDGKLSNAHVNLDLHTRSHQNDDKKPQEGLAPVIDPGSALPNTNNCTYSSKEGHLLNLSRKIKLTTKFFKNWPNIGEDFTIPQAIFSLDMWILFVSITCGVGSTLTAVDNMGQIGESLGYGKKNINTFVSLISIWSFLGRVLTGFVSEILLRRYHFPRTLLLSIMIGLSCVGHLLLAFPAPNTLYIASVMVGLCFGAQFTLLFAIISELFGLKYYATLVSLIGLASPLGSYLLNVRVAGHLYDQEASRQQQVVQHSEPMNGGELKCIGSECYKLTFLIMTVLCVFGSLVSYLLVLRTKKFYSQDIYSKFYVEPNNKENQQEIGH